MSKYEQPSPHDKLVNVGFRAPDPNKLRQTQHVEHERAPTTGVWDSITSFPGRDSGYDNPNAFLRSFKREIILHPERKHLLIVMGEPGGGKSTVLEQAMAHAMNPGEEQALDADSEGDDEPNLPRFLQEQGYKPHYYYLPWGDASEHLPARWYADKTKDYHDYPHVMAKKREEIKAVEYLYRTVFDRVMKQPTIPGEIDILLADFPVITGAIFDGQEGGIQRANQLLYDLVHKEAEFRGLDYDVHVAGLSASGAVRKKGFADRAALTGEHLTEEEIKKRMQQQGMVVHGLAPGAAEQIAKEVANPKQLIYIERDVNEVATKVLAQHDSKGGSIAPDIFDHNYLLREQAIGGFVIPYFLEQIIKVSENRRINAWNAHPLNVVDVYAEFTLNRPVADYRKEIIARMKAERSTRKKGQLSPLYEIQPELGSEV